MICATGNELTVSGEGLAALILEPTFPGRVDGHIDWSLERRCTLILQYAKHLPSLSSRVIGL